MEVDKISFIGLGKLGLPLAAHFARSGIQVVAVDKNQTLVDKLNNEELFDFYFESSKLAKCLSKQTSSNLSISITFYSLNYINSHGNLLILKNFDEFSWNSMNPH